MWSHMRRRQMDGWKFRRQVPIGRYVVDFVCFKARLVVELDGNSHDVDDAKAGYDDARQAWLESQGFRVLRLSADYPESDPIEGAWDTIDLALSETVGAADPSRSRPGSRASRIIAEALGTTDPLPGATSPPALRATSPASGEDEALASHIY
jgi:very-short-patch-repair endonuclease